MKYLLITVSTLLLFACNSTPKFKYKVINSTYTKDRPGIFYTDTLEFTGDSMGYHNTNGSYVLISDTCGYDCKINILK
jgi:hypothetical protein